MMKTRDKILSYLNGELLQIEKRTDISDDEKVTRIIRLFSATISA